MHRNNLKEDTISSNFQEPSTDKKFSRYKNMMTSSVLSGSQIKQDTSEKTERGQVCQWSELSFPSRVSSVDGVNQGHVRDVVEWVGAVVVIAGDERKECAILEDDCPGFLRVPLGPRDQTLLADPSGRYCGTCPSNTRVISSTFATTWQHRTE